MTKAQRLAKHQEITLDKGRLKEQTTFNDVIDSKDIKSAIKKLQELSHETNQQTMERSN